MTQPAVLNQVALGYAPMIDRHRLITAVRLTVVPVLAHRLPPAAELLQALADVWPADAGRLSLNVASDTMVQELVAARPPANMMVEVPQLVACDPTNEASLIALHQRGSTLLIRGRPTSAMPRAVLPCFAYSLVGVREERRDGTPPPGGVTRAIPHIQTGVESVAAMEDAFKRGAIAVLGWPMDAVFGRGGGSGSSSMPLIVELMTRVDRGESVGRLEEVVKSDPALSYRLLRYMNAAAFGMPVEVTSLRHAIMLLGHQKLKRWLALLLASASKDPNMKPVTYAALRRGLLLEALANDTGLGDQAGDMFICGVFSLLDRMMGQPFERLLASIPVADAVRAALVDRAGPYRAYLRLVEAIDTASFAEYVAAADALMLSPADINHVLLQVLVTARQID